MGVDKDEVRDSSQHNLTSGYTHSELRDLREGDLFWGRPFSFSLPLSIFFKSLLLLFLSSIQQTFAEHLLRQRHWTHTQLCWKVSSRRAEIFVLLAAASLVLRTVPGT